MAVVGAAHHIAITFSAWTVGYVTRVVHGLESTALIDEVLDRIPLFRCDPGHRHRIWKGLKSFQSGLASLVCIRHRDRRPTNSCHRGGSRAVVVIHCVVDGNVQLIKNPIQAHANVVGIVIAVADQSYRSRAIAAPP
jgi:hypothetical protein